MLDMRKRKNAWVWAKRVDIAWPSWPHTIICNSKAPCKMLFFFFNPLTVFYVVLAGHTGYLNLA